MRKIYFLCYSRYVMMIAYMIKELYHKNDECVMIISDEIANENGIIEHVAHQGLWNNVVRLEEKNKSYHEINRVVDEFINNHQIDVFYTAHIMRYASHYFVEKLNEATKINMYDEGIISLDIISGYKEWCKKIHKEGMVEFRFDRIKKFFVLFPQITTSFGNVQIEGINIHGLITNANFVNDLNNLFQYEHELFDKKFLIIDADIAVQGDVSQEYENMCASKLINILGAKDSCIKIKPSEKIEVITKKYNHSDVSFISNGLVPFEVQYLNWIVSKKYPKVIVAFPTTLIWNMLLINENFDVDEMEFISIAKIMSKEYFDSSIATNMLNKIEKYKTCFSNVDNINIPKDWDEFEQCIKKGEWRK